MTIYIAVVGITAVLWVVIPLSYFSAHGSPVAPPASGRTVPIIVNHNRTVYIAPGADRIIYTGNVITITILGASLTGLILWPVKRRTGQTA